MTDQQKIDQLSGNPGELDLIERLRAERDELIANHAIAVMRVSAERDEAARLMHNWSSMIDDPDIQTNKHGFAITLLFGIQKAARTFLQSIARETGND